MELKEVKNKIQANSEVSLEALQESKETRILKSELRGEAGKCSCTGWRPKIGKWKDTGYKCDYFGWTTPWCYVEKDYIGPGHEFVKPSGSYKGKFFAPCKGENKGKCADVTSK